MFRSFRAAIAMVALSVCSLIAVRPAHPAELLVSSFGSGEIKRFDTETQKFSTFATGLKEPFGLAFDSAGNLIVANSGKGEILKFSPDGKTRTVLASGLGYPVGVAVSKTGDIYTTEYRPDPDDGSGSTNVWRIPAGGGDRVPFASKVIGATGLAFSSSGTLLSTNYSAGFGTAVYEFSPSGQASSLLPYRGFKAPYGLIAVGTDLYISDYGSGSIFLRSEGAFPTVWGTAQRGVMGIAFSPTGELWGVNMLRGSIFRVGPKLGSAPGTAIEVATGLLQPTGIAFKS